MKYYFLAVVLLTGLVVTIEYGVAGLLTTKTLGFLFWYLIFFYVPVWLAVRLYQWVQRKRSTKEQSIYVLQSTSQAISISAKKSVFKLRYALYALAIAVSAMNATSKYGFAGSDFMMSAAISLFLIWAIASGLDLSKKNQP